MAGKIGKRRGPRYRLSGESSVADSVSLRELREHTAGLSNRLPVKSLEAMRAGFVLSPQGAARRYLMGGHRMGLPRAWGQRFALFIQRTVDSIWLTDATPLHVLRERAIRAEAEDDVNELRCVLNETLENVQAEIDSKSREIACDQEIVAILQRKLEGLR